MAFSPSNLVGKTTSLVKTDATYMLNTFYLLLSLVPLYMFFAFGGLFISSNYDRHLFSRLPFLQVTPKTSVAVHVAQAVFIGGFLGATAFVLNSILTYLIGVLNPFLGTFGTANRNVNLTAFLTAMTLIFSSTLSTKVQQLKAALLKKNVLTGGI